ncbi:B3 domain-containing protein REM19-like isoform X1 [Glycine soja]|uniref:B3 domain-containing protein REM19-like isoform X1 n=1 Tax=Glycine soja TaxID=3848 RepID=UPI0003DE8D66|nr:B3 domain-containing protein REM19-like isoform X1 [Glycine soja]
MLLLKGAVMEFQKSIQRTITSMVCFLVIINTILILNFVDATTKCLRMTSPSLSASLANSIYVPKKFIRSHEMDHINEVKLQVGKRSWNVKLDCYGRFTSGLHDFLSQCNVEAGDVCHFELIDKKKFVFEVRVTRCISID